jgi:hypothetical protein
VFSSFLSQVREKGARYPVLHADVRFYNSILELEINYAFSDVLTRI